MVMKTVGLTEPLAKAMAPLFHRLADAFVFGSVATGSDNSESNIDVAVVGDVNMFDVSPLVDAAQAELGRPVHVNVYSEHEWALDDPIIVAIKRGPRVDLMAAIRAEAS
jgi:predicted nucleotidyltransferase